VIFAVTAQMVSFVRPFYSMKIYFAALVLFAGAFLAPAQTGTNRTGPDRPWWDSVHTDFASTIFAQPATNRVALTNRPAWESSLAIGFTVTRGNSDTLLATANLQTHKKTAFDEITLGADAAYGDNNSVQSANDAHAFGQYNHLFTGRFFGYFRADGLHDEIADLQYRVTLSPGAGYYFVKQTNTTLAGECGPAMVFQRLGHVEDNYVTLRLAERFEHKFTENNARVWQSVEFLPQINAFNNFVVNAELGIEAGISKKISLQACLQDNFVNEPAPGRQQNDLKIVSGLKYKF
jgi:putative salt-induced outer membrane protein YdiY